MNPRPRTTLLDPGLQRPSALASVPRNPDRIWLDKNENADPGLGALLHEILTEMPALALTTYPEAGELYRKLARWLGVGADALLLTPGSDGAIRLAFEAFVEPGEPVVHTVPTFAMYPVYCQMFGAAALALDYARSSDGPRIEPSAIFKALREHKPKLLCLPNPDSPTGTTFAPDILAEILECCETTGTVLLLDEAYHPFFEWTAVPWTLRSRNLVVARTFAKAWGAAGLRIGYAVAHPETIGLMHKMRPMYEVSTLSVEFMSRLIDRSAEMVLSVSRINDGKAFFLERMEQLGFCVLRTAGNFLHVDFGDRGPAVHAALADRVYYRPSFDHPCLRGYSRFSAAPRQTMARVAELIETVA